MAQSKILRDGRGKPIDETALYYIQDTRQHNGLLWWRPEGAGYTCDLLDAGVYPGSHAKGKRDTDVYWPVEEVRKHLQVQLPRLCDEDCVIERKALEDLIKLCVKVPEIRQSKAFEAVEQQGEIWCACESDECLCGLQP